MNNPDEEKLRSSVSAVFQKVDEDINSTIFQEDWGRAKASFKYNNSLVSQSRSVSQFIILKRKLFTPSVLLIAPMCLLILVIFISVENNEDSNDVTPTLINNRTEQITSLIPSANWRASTDELLQIDVRQYESKLLTLVKYEPFTMEIK